MKLSLRSKLIARTTPGSMVRSERPMAESASVLIMPPCTKPEWLAMSSVVVISTTAVPSPVSTKRRPSQAHAREVPSPFRGKVGWGCAEFNSLLTALTLRYGHAGGGRARDQPALVVENIRLAEQQRLLHLDDATHGAKASVDDGTKEVDLQLDGRVPQAIFLERGQRHPHRRVSDLGDDAALHDPAAVPVLRPRLQLKHHAAGLGFGDARAQRLHPSGGLGRKQRLRAVHVLHGPRRVFLQLRTVVRCFGAAAIARATSASSSLTDFSPESRRISFSRSRTMASKSSRGTPAPIISSTASAWMSLSWRSIA